MDIKTSKAELELAATEVSTAQTEYTDDAVISKGELKTIDDEEKTAEVVEEAEQAELDAVTWELEAVEAETAVDDLQTERDEAAEQIESTTDLQDAANTLELS